MCTPCMLRVHVLRVHVHVLRVRVHVRVCVVVLS